MKILIADDHDLIGRAKSLISTLEKRKAAPAGPSGAVSPVCTRPVVMP